MQATFKPELQSIAPPLGGAEHFLALDGLRGIAALLVMMAHSTYMMADSARYSRATTAVLMVIGNSGHRPVILFFVLSGFVLYLAFARSPETPYAQFILRRMLRIYPAMLVALAFSIAVHLLAAPRVEPGLGPWTAGLWVVAIDMTTIVRNMLMLGVRDADSVLDPVIWSLAIEMRFSLLLPLLALLCQRSRIVLVVLSVAAYSSAVVLLDRLGMRPAYMFGGTPIGTIAVTMFYLPSFALGILAADLFLEQRRRGWRVPIVLTSVVTVAALIAARLVRSDLAGALACTILVFIACQPGLLAALGRWRAVKFLGRISYSLYLIHFPILTTLAYAFSPRLPPIAAAIAGPVVALGIAAVMYRYVELPGIAVGRRLAAPTKMSPT